MTTLRDKIKKELEACPNTEQIKDALRNGDKSYIRGVLKVQEPRNWSPNLSKFLREWLSQQQQPAL